MSWSLARNGILSGALLALSAISAFADPSVTAVLSNSETAIGQPVELSIQMQGASNPKPPAEIKVDGLEIQSTGRSQQVQMQNFNVSYSVTFTYMIVPSRAGTFKIPPQPVEVGGRALQTPELVLNVAASSGRSSRPGRGQTNANIDPSQVGFVEMLLPKSVAYVGEMVPVQIRLGLDMSKPVEALGAGPQLTGQGFTTQKLTEPRQTIETINGRSYQVFIFKTAIAPARSGKLEIGPVEINPVVRVPRGGGRNPGIPRNGPFDDPFFNNFFNDPAFAPSMPKEVHLKSETATLEVKPLPPNPPADFSGAVGTFSLKADANPKKIQVGDPITVTATITGRGNFDRVGSPVLENEDGWHKYPPSDNFKQDDDVGISGAKTFEMVVSGKDRRPSLPPLLFSFFDPVKENYVTLRSDPIPLQMTGGAAPTATPAPSAAPATSAAPSAAPAAPAPKQVEDILPQLDDRTAAAESFAPLYERRSFWLSQLLPLTALLGIVGWKIRQSKRGDREAMRLAQWQHEAGELQRKLRRDGASPQQYVADASRAIQLKTALAKNVDPNVVDAETAAAAFRLDEGAEARLRQIFAQSDELQYSGARNGNDALSPQQRREILDLVENLRA